MRRMSVKVVRDRSPSKGSNFKRTGIAVHREMKLPGSVGFEDTRHNQIGAFGKINRTTDLNISSKYRFGKME